MPELDYQEVRVPSQTCVLAFASGGNDRFEWGPTLRAMGVSHVLFRDLTKHDYLQGVQGIGGPEAMRDYIEHLMGVYPRVLCMGLSSGSYGALLYGELAQVDELIMISPLTTAPEGGVADLKPRIPEDGPTPRSRAFYSDGEGTHGFISDRDMALRVGIWDVTLVPGVSHSALARLMRDNGMIRKLIVGGAGARR
jgi:hypothetical protein